jgi:hypothetical protein
MQQIQLQGEMIWRERASRTDAIIGVRQLSWPAG